MRTILIAIVLFLSIYQDFFTFEYFGEIAKTPIVFLTPFFLLYEALSINKGKLFVSKYQKYFIIYYCIVFLVTIFYFVLIYFKYWSFEVLGENVIMKAIRLAVYPLVYFLFYRFIINFLRNDPQNLKILFNAVYFNQLILIIVLLLELPAIKDGVSAISFFHPEEYKYWRVRLLTMEASWAGPVTLIFSLTPILLLGFVEVNKWFKRCIILTSVSFLLIFFIYNSSKGFIICFVLGIVAYVIRYVIKRGIKPIYIFGFLFLSIIPLLNFQDQIIYIYENIGQEKTTTFGTRFVSYLAGIKTFFTNPMGTGFGGLTAIYPRNIEYFVDVASQNLNTAEIKQYLSSPRALSTKTYFFDQLIFGGVFFLLFFFMFFVNRLFWIKKIMFENFYMMYSYIILICIILSGITYLTFHIKYEIWFFLALIDFIENKYKNRETMLLSTYGS